MSTWDTLSACDAQALAAALDRAAALPETARIAVTAAAAAHIRKMVSKAQALGLRLGVKRSGCSGWMYQVELAHEVREGDYAFSVAGEPWVVLVASTDLAAIQGTTIDLAGDFLSQRLVYHNPNAQASCGCGESFAL